DALMFPEIGVALVSSAAMASRGLGVQGEETPAGGPIEAIEPEYFVFANDQADYLRGFARATEMIARELGAKHGAGLEEGEDIDVEAPGAPWGLKACRVPP